MATDLVNAVPGRTVAAGAVVVGATGAAAGIGVLAMGGSLPHHNLADTTITTVNATTPRAVAPDVKAALRQRAAADANGAGHRVSRGSERPALVSVQRAEKSRALSVSKQDLSGALTEQVAPTDPQDIARQMLAHDGWGSDQFACLDSIYMRESRWNVTAANPSSGAYGIPQALPGDKMAAYGADWRTNPATQLAWGLSYIRSRYGSPCGAWGFWESHSWY